MLNWLMALLQAPDLPPLGLLILGLIPLVASFLSTFLYDGLKTLLEKFLRLPPVVIAVGSYVFSFLVGYLGAAIGMPDLPGDASLWTSEIFMGVLTVLGNQGVFRMFKRAANASAGGSADATAALDAKGVQ